MHQEGRAHSCESSKDLKTFLAPAVLAAMVIIFFARFLITGRILLLRDLFFDWYPWRLFYQSCLSQGTFPLWNPYTGCGEPFLADIQTALFYPFNYLYFLLPVGLCTIVLSAFHTFLAGIGIYLLCRLWRVSSQGSLLAAVARYRGADIRGFFRGDAAFANPDIYTFLEKEDYLYAIRLPANQNLQRAIEHLLTRPVGRPSKAPKVFYDRFLYQAQSWDIARRVVAKVEWHQGELFPRVGFIVTNLSRSDEGVVKFYNGRGTAEQWIKEGKNAVKWTRLSCHDFVDNQVRLQLFALAYNLGNFLRRLALPRSVKHWSLTTLREKLVKIGAKVVTHARYVTFQMAEVAIPRRLFEVILQRIRRLGPLMPAPT